MPSILIVEDNTTFRRLLKDTLQSRFPSVEISEAASGEEAELMTAITPRDVIFVDIELPGQNGLELTRKIKTRHPGSVVVIFTNHDLPEYRAAAKRNKADFFLSKSSTTEADVLKLVESILSGPGAVSGKPESPQPF